MKLYNILILLWRIYTKNVFTTILLLVMCLMSFYMIDEVLQNYYSSRYRINRVVNEFGVEIEDVNYIKVMDKAATSEDSDMIKKYVRSLEGVKGCGYYTDITVSGIKGAESVTVICAEKQLESLGNLKMTAEQREALNRDWGAYEPVLLGCRYKDVVEIGTIFQMSYFYEGEDCVVAGFLEKGAAWPQNADVLLGGSFGGDAYTLDNSGILLTERYERYDNSMGEASVVYYVADIEDNDKIQKTIVNHAIDNKIGAGVFNIGEEADKVLTETNISEDKVFVAAVLLTLLAIVSVSASSVIYSLMNKSQFGVMMVCGVRKKDVNGIIILQNALVYIVAAVSVWIIRQIEIFGTLIPKESTYISQVLYLQDFVPHNVYIPIIFVGVVMVMVSVSSALPVYLIGKESLVSLVYDRK
ncbi:MAG: hypothetical protein IJB96_02790 [Lachnospira sp.]|nr:hypothetical protein [Lachnospira sp.]